VREPKRFNLKTIGLNEEYFSLDANHKGIDKECVELCKAMNLFPGIQTVESCCGHGKDSYRIWFIPKSLSCLPELLYWFDGCHCGLYGWKCIVTTDCGMSPASFKIEGPIGKQGYDESIEIAQLMEDFLNKSKKGGEKE